MNGAQPVRAERSGRRFELRELLAFTAVLVAVVPFGGIVVLVRTKVTWLQKLDLHTAQRLHDFDASHPGFVTTMRVITDAGGSLTWIAVLGLVAGWLVIRRLFRLAAFVAVTELGSSLLNAAIKALVGRTRPVLQDPIATTTGKSFPSGHTQSAIVGYGILLLIFLPVVPRLWRILMSVLATLMVLLIGFSRVALGVHYLSDVVGGLFIGAAWLLALTAAFSAWRQRRSPPPVEPSTGLEPENADRLRPD